MQGMSVPRLIDRRSVLTMLALGAGCAGLAACSHRENPMAPTSAPPASPAAQTLYLIRHAEKPTGRDAQAGIDEHGGHDKHSLTPRGWSRADALVRLFTASGRGIAVPQHLFASKPNGSKRSLQTLMPLSKKLGLPIDAAIAADDAQAAAAAVTATPGVTLMAWEHHAIPAVVAALGDVHPTPPAKWPDKRFDVIWVFTRSGSGWQFSQIPQLLLDDDRPYPI